VQYGFGPVSRLLLDDGLLDELRLVGPPAHELGVALQQQ
jgi:hypothetical protein